MNVQNPYDLFRAECQVVLKDALSKALPNHEPCTVTLKKTQNIDFGQLSASLCFELAKQLGQKTSGACPASCGCRRQKPF